MPGEDKPVRKYEVQDDPAHKGRFRVVDTTQHGPDGGPDVKGANMDKTTATKQWRLLEAVEHDPGFRPAPGVPSTLKHTPGPGKLPGSGYSKTPPGGGRHYGNS